MNITGHRDRSQGHADLVLRWKGGALSELTTPPSASHQRSVPMRTLLAWSAARPPTTPTRDLLAALREDSGSRLTAHQREVLVAIALSDVPIDVLAERLNTTRGALYKTLHDARQKLRAALAAGDLASMGTSGARSLDRETFQMTPGAWLSAWSGQLSLRSAARSASRRSIPTSSSSWPGRTPMLRCRECAPTCRLLGLLR